ncbi:ABC transporter permease [Engelhardtia mirabilis]|uniref:ABC-2 family transporter protein n=1 Tax=Engelhardtia mirabilis TaxID=2528011 RepID=A0A518BRC4_9BACT|nr:ABC-2 family transporter protein [Planctomycetes bacterium Pla133]QDV03845.1 ABC-2 family transporter protein [Planctomycetes bacterium Pla86]
MYVLLVAAHELRRRLRDPLALLLMAAVPLGIAVVLRFAFGGTGEDATTPVAEVLVLDRDQSLVSSLLLGALGQAGDKMPISTEVVTDEDQARRRMDRGDATALLIIPESFDRALLLEEPATLELVVNPSQRVLPKIVEESLAMLVEAHFYVHRVAGSTLARFGDGPQDASVYPNEDIAAVAVEFNELGARLAEWIDPPRIELDVVVEGDKDDSGEASATALDTGGVVMASILAMTLIFAALGLSEDLWVEKKSGTLRRAQAAPRPLAGWLGGKLLAHGALFAALTTGGMLAARLGFSVHFTGELLALAWLTTSTTVFVTLLLVAQSMARTQRAGTIVASLFVYPLLMIGGAFFPLEAMPDGLAAIGVRTPVGWALVRFKSILAGSAEAGSLLVDFSLVLAVGALLFVVALRRLPGFSAR